MANSIARFRDWYQHAPAPYSWLLMIVVLGIWVLLVGFLGTYLSRGFDAAVGDLPSEAIRIGKKLGGLYVVFLVVYSLLRLAGFNRSHWNQINKALRDRRNRKR